MIQIQFAMLRNWHSFGLVMRYWLYKNGEVYKRGNGNGLAFIRRFRATKEMMKDDAVGRSKLIYEIMQMDSGDQNVCCLNKIDNVANRVEWANRTHYSEEKKDIIRK